MWCTAVQATFVRNAILRVGVCEATLNRDVLLRHTHVFSCKTKPEGKATSQSSSGRCWLFAACNVMRVAMMKKYALPTDFELSQSFLFFFDKLERANYFLGNVVKTADQPLDSRVVQHLLAPPQQDGGQWDMIVNLVQKYGIVPKVRLRAPSCWLSLAR